MNVLLNTCKNACEGPCINVPVSVTVLTQLNPDCDGDYHSLQGKDAHNPGQTDSETGDRRADRHENRSGREQ